MADELVIRGKPPRTAVVPLLQTEGLPVSDLTDPHLEHFFVAGPEFSPVALIGLEIFGTDALLRSLIVANAARTRGTGTALVLHAENYATARRVSTIYLLTTTAELFFERRGYRRVERGQAPATIQSTREFAALCPGSSAFMMKRL